MPKGPQGQIIQMSGDGIEPQEEKLNLEGNTLGVAQEESERDRIAMPPLVCVPPHFSNTLTKIFRKIQRARQRRLFIIISEFIGQTVCADVYKWHKTLRQNGLSDDLDMLMHSPGGDITACYKTARLLSQYTNAWEALVPDYAASGATRICLGSCNIVLADIAQLGPLDPQVLSKRPEKFFAAERQSPLEAFQAVRYLREATLTILDASMMFLLERQIAPQLALETSRQLAGEIIQPIIGKIDPYDLGAFDLDSSLAKDYCRRVCDPVDQNKITQREANFEALVERYPAHEFAIDREEAAQLGLTVSAPSDELNDLFDA